MTVDQVETALPDAAARHVIATATDRTLFVDAGAGSGKTRSLVERVRTLVLRDGVPLRHIAAVTFTEKAGAELRDRLRADLEQVWRAHPAGSPEHERAADALADLDSAAIGTLHSFARRILTEHAVAAGLPPLVEVLDEVGSSVAFEERWAALQAALLDDDAMARPLLLALAGGMKLDHVRSLARMLGADWDLIAPRILAAADTDPGPDPATGLAATVEVVLAAAEAIVGQRQHCTDPEDKLLARLDELGRGAAALAAAPDDPARLTALLALGELKFARKGQRTAWIIPIQVVRDAASDVAARAERTASGIRERALREVTAWTARRVLDDAQRRRAEGRLEFHDLLVLARDLLARDTEARQALHNSYAHLMLDEFQDTDPIQIELAVRIAGGAAASAQDWRDVAVPPGRLFLVGDAKQSIYRFRRASIATYLEAQERLGEREVLSTNFRTVAPVLHWVNAVFGQVIEEDPGNQPAFGPLDAFRDPPALAGPAVAVLGADAHDDLPRAGADELRRREAADVAEAVRRAVGHWDVEDEAVPGGRRPVRYGDVAVLVPARTSLPFLEEALDRARIPYRAEASSLVYEAAEVRDLLAAARAIADPSDELSLVTVLRSPLFGCGDDDLWAWRHAGGRFSLWSEVEDAAVADGPVAQGLAYLRGLYGASRWAAPSELLGRIVADRRMLEVAATRPRTRDAWRRLRFVVDQARAWSQVSHGGLRAYLAWAAHQGQETTRVAESVLPETDVDAVRVMTVHAAKGLEFGVVVLSGMTSQPNNRGGVRLLWPPDGGYAVKLASGVQTGDFDAVAPVDEQMDHLEKRRLLYVAATRARDHLVVSLHRKAGSTSATGAQILADAGAGVGVAGDAPERITADLEHAWDGSPELGWGAGGGPEPAVVPPPDWDDWEAGAQHARRASERDAAVTASGLEGTEPELVLTEPAPEAAGVAKGPRDLALPPWSKGRYGSQVGRAVHGVLQTVDLATGAGLDEAVAAQCVAEGVTGYENLVTDLVRSGLASDLVRRAAARDPQRETYVGTVLAEALGDTPPGTLIEGYVDLLFRDDDGTVVIGDHKTDAVPAGAYPSRIAYYGPQLRAYARCVADATGGPVRAWLLFLHPEGAVEAEVGL